VPGYDRHFTLAESLGFELLSIPMDDQGPVIAEAQRLADDPAVKGMWLVPMYSNPTGITITEQRARELAAMPTAAVDFTLLWDNAYGMHHLREEHPDNLDILSLCAEAGNPERAWIFASTSKITHAGAGVSFFGGGPATVDWMVSNLGKVAIGPDKINQLRHLRFFSDSAGVEAHMRKHAEIIAPKFDAVLSALEKGLGPDSPRSVDAARWRLLHHADDDGGHRRSRGQARRRGGSQTDSGRSHPSLWSGSEQQHHPHRSDDAQSRGGRIGRSGSRRLCQTRQL
jgi:DNA-binding transcriptional MocR family regulator